MAFICLFSSHVFLCFQRSFQCGKFSYEYILPLVFLYVGTWYGVAANIFIALSSTGWTAYSRNTIVWRIQTVYPFMRGVESTPGCKRWSCIGGRVISERPLCYRSRAAQEDAFLWWTQLTLIYILTLWEDDSKSFLESTH
jgi:hypothetical protein